MKKENKKQKEEINEKIKNSSRAICGCFVNKESNLITLQCDTAAGMYFKLINLNKEDKNNTFFFDLLNKKYIQHLTKAKEEIINRRKLKIKK